MMHPEPCDLCTQTEDSGVRSLGNGRFEATGPKPSETLQTGTELGFIGKYLHALLHKKTGNQSDQR